MGLNSFSLTYITGLRTYTYINIFMNIIKYSFSFFLFTFMFFIYFRRSIFTFSLSCAHGSNNYLTCIFYAIYIILSNKFFFLVYYLLFVCYEISVKTLFNLNDSIVKCQNSKSSVFSI